MIKIEIWRFFKIKSKNLIKIYKNEMKRLYN